MLPKQEVIAALPNTLKQTQGDCWNEQRNMAQIKEQVKTPEKELNEMEISNLSDAEFKTAYKDAQGTWWGPHSIKKIQSEMKDTLIEIKNNWTGTVE